MREKLEKLLQRGKNWVSLPAAAVLAVGCLLLLIPVGGESDAADSVGKESQALFDLEEFELRLEQALSRISGAGETKVILSLDSGERQILAQESRDAQLVNPLKNREHKRRGAQLVGLVAGGFQRHNAVLKRSRLPLGRHREEQLFLTFKEFVEG